MITTGCEGCCFLHTDSNGKGCAIGQMCVVQKGKAFTPGYCRMCRSNDWAKKQDTTEISKLYKDVFVERELKFDMLVYFDETTSKIEDLDRTLQSDWYSKYAKKVIIMDVTGFGNRKNIALEYIQTRDHPVSTVVDSSAEHESVSQREATIRRVSRQVASPFFLVISAGNIIDNFETFAMSIKYVLSRVIHWSFPHRIGTTAIAQRKLSSGLFITAPYRSIMRPKADDLPLPNDEQPLVGSFTEKVATEEEETDIKLSWLCDSSWLA